MKTVKMSRSELIAWICLLFSAILVHFSHMQVLKEIAGYKSLYHNKRFILNPEMAKALSLGFEQTLADIYWLSFVQYYGDWRDCANENYRYAPAYLRLIVSLDPHFIRPYWFVAFVLAGDMGLSTREAANKAYLNHDLVEYKRLMDIYRNDPATKEAQEILDFGIKNNPDDWSLPYITGFSQYLFHRNYKEAARYYQMAARVPGSPPWLEKMAVIMNSNVSSLIRMDAASWQNTFENASDPSLKERSRAELQIVWSQIYHYAPTEQIRARAIAQLKHFEVPLLAKKGLPPPSSEVGEDFLRP